MKRILAWMMSLLIALASINVNQPMVYAAGTNLVVDGSFEEPLNEGVDFFKRSIPGWELSEGVVFEMPNGLVAKPYDGKQFLELDGVSYGSLSSVTKISQEIPTTEGETYKLSFAFSPRKDIPDNKLNVYWGDTLIEQLDQSGEGLSDTDWKVYSYAVKATSSTTRVSFDNLNETADGSGSFLDAVSLEPVEFGLGEDLTVVIGPDDKVTVPVKIQIPEKPGTLPLDLMLTQDLTASFKDDLPVLQKLIPNLVEELQKIQPNTSFGLASFTDKKVYGTSNYYLYETELPLTNNTNAFEQAVAKLETLASGKDTPESSLSALMQVALRANDELNFRKNTRRVAIVSTDAAYKKAGDDSGKANKGNKDLSESEDYPSVAQVKKAINEANIVPIFLVTSDVTSKYNDLVSQLGVGAVVKLESDSSNLIEALVKALEVINQNLSVVVVNDEYGYVESVEPERFEDVAPGSTVTSNVTFKYSGRGSGEEVIIRALGTGDLVVDVKVVL